MKKIVTIRGNFVSNRRRKSVSSSLALTPHGGEHKIDGIGVNGRDGDAPVRSPPLITTMTRMMMMMMMMSNISSTTSSSTIAELDMHSQPANPCPCFQWRHSANQIKAHHLFLLLIARPLSSLVTLTFDLLQPKSVPHKDASNSSRVSNLVTIAPRHLELSCAMTHWQRDGRSGPLNPRCSPSQWC